MIDELIAGLEARDQVYVSVVGLVAKGDGFSASRIVNSLFVQIENTRRAMQAQMGHALYIDSLVMVNRDVDGGSEITLTANVTHEQEDIIFCEARDNGMMAYRCIKNKLVEREESVTAAEIRSQLS